MSVSVQTEPAPSCDVAAIPGIVAKLRAAYDSGRTRPIEWRRHQLERIEALVKENLDAWLAALKADLGKPLLEAYTTDLAMVAGEAAAARKQLRRWLRPRRVSTPLNVQPGRSRLLPEPLGVVLVIGPWNYPVQLVLLPLVGAVAAGNAVVIKPSEVAPHVSALLAELLPRYLDPDAVTVVEGAVEETTALLAERFDHIFYTGNGAIGRVVMAAAAKHLTPVTLELGGKSPCLVDESANLEVAAHRIAWGKFLNAGQTCIAPDYVLVHASREEELLGQLAATIREFYGESPRDTPDYARIVNERHHRRLAALLKDGEVVVGGEADESERYIAPTVLRNVPADAAVMRDEIFGPILPVIPVRDMDAAIDFVNGREKPLALYVFAEDQAVADRVLERTSSGGACVNATIWQVANPNLPFGGVGESGTGAYHGRASFETFTHWKPVLQKSTRVDPKIVYPPYGKLKTSLVKKLL